MRVLFLLTQSLEYPSGLGRYWPLAKQMVRLGYQVEIAALHPAWHSLPSREFSRDGVRVSYVSQMHVYQSSAASQERRYYGTTKLVAVTIAATIALMRLALRRNADVIHIAKAQPMNGVAGWLASRLRQQGLYVDCDDDEAASNRFGAEWQRSIVAWWEKRLPSLARGVTVNTTFLRDRCINAGIPLHRVRLVPNGFDPDRFQTVPQGAVESLRQRWGLSGRRVVLYLGSVSLTNHPIQLLMDAFLEVRRQLPTALLLIVGTGEDMATVRHAIHERELTNSVVLAGHADPSLVASIYASSDLSVDPVFDDDTARARSPLKIVESMAMGIPVVTGDVGDRARMLANGRGGLLVTPGNSSALAEGIVTLLQDPSRRVTMAEQARVLSQEFRWDSLAKEFIKVYDC